MQEDTSSKSEHKIDSKTDDLLTITIDKEDDDIKTDEQTSIQENTEAN